MISRIQAVVNENKHKQVITHILKIEVRESMHACIFNSREMSNIDVQQD